MTDRPILFSGPMVRALLAGTKTQTRRIIQRAPTHADYEAVRGEDGVWRFIADGPDVVGHERAQLSFDPGDRLWVREAHATFAAHGQHRSDGQRWGPWSGLPTRLSPDATRIAYFREGFDRCRSGPWKPGIHMPRWASRLTLAVTDVRVERLQDISEADAFDEGMRPAPDGTFRSTLDELQHDSACAAYAVLWDHLNASRGYGWATNPWVMAVTFAVHHQNIDALGAREAA